jgi:hypothetical protein
MNISRDLFRCGLRACWMWQVGGRKPRKFFITLWSIDDGDLDQEDYREGNFITIKLIMIIINNYFIHCIFYFIFWDN